MVDVGNPSSVGLLPRALNRSSTTQGARDYPEFYGTRLSYLEEKTLKASTVALCFVRASARYWL